MSKLNYSPERNTLHQIKYKERINDPTTSEDEKTTARDMIDFYNSMYESDRKTEITPEWKKYNMEYDLRSTAWICDKVKASNVYAQHLYASMCNTHFIKNDVWCLLKGKTWSCSWRHAGGIVADMKESGDYIDWYCSGIQGDSESEEELAKFTSEQLAEYAETSKYVPEGTVTMEIIEDLKRLGWLVVLDYNAQD